MNVLVACECSGTVRDAFRRLGHDAYSCDLQPADDGSSFHYREDAIAIINSGVWDLVIAHPPCTHLCSAGAKWFRQKQADGRQQEGIDCFMAFVQACELHAPMWAIENPIGIMSRLYRRPDQIVQPWQYGDSASKSTCLWLSGLPKLVPTDIVDDGGFHVTKSGKRLPNWYNLPPSPDRAKIRSKTFPGIANAMAAQWHDHIFSTGKRED